MEGALSKLWLCACVCVHKCSVYLLRVSHYAVCSYNISLSHRLKWLHCRWGNMLAMDQGLVEEWLSEFKVLLSNMCVCMSVCGCAKKILKSTYPWSACSAFSVACHSIPRINLHSLKYSVLRELLAPTQGWALADSWPLLKLRLGRV